MFYSHEILNSSQYGVATIWLVATVGNGKGSQKRLNRKAMEQVNVPKACETIIDPGAPLALRLQGNLMYGVSRVFARQCGYLLSDAEKTQSDMMTFFRAMQTSDLDPKAGKAKRQNITLEDDPGFDPNSVLPNLDLLSGDKDLAFFTSQASSNGTSQMTPLGAFSHSSSSGHRPSFMNFGLDLPNSSHSPGTYRLPSDFGDRSSSQAKQLVEPEIMGEYRPFAQDDMAPFEGLELDFDRDGNLLGIADEVELPALPGQTPSHAQLLQGSEALDKENEEQTVLEGDDAHLFDLGEEALPDADAFAPAPTVNQLTATAEHAAAPLKKTRRRKLQTMVDVQDRVPGNEYRDWTLNYAETMEANNKRPKVTTQTQAKKAAAAFVFDNGLAQVGITRAFFGITHPLADHFAGLSLRARLQGRLPEEMEEAEVPRGRRRKSSEVFGDEEEEGRRVKQRVDEGVELGRADGFDLGDQPMIGDDTAPEIGMEGVEGMEDRHFSYMMPWSHQGSVVPSSVRAPGSSQKGGPAPSPLHGRGSAIKSVERHSDPVDPAFVSEDFGQLGSHSSLDLGGPVGGPEFSQFRDSQATNAGLDMASQDFLSYAMDHVENNSMTRQENSETRRWVDFEQLASPGIHTKAVAAQAFLHVLSLTTKNVISVEQDGEGGFVPFGTIRVGIDISEHSGNEDSDDELA